MKKTMTIVVLVVVLALAGLAAFVVSGSYDIGADKPHWALTERVIGTLRDRSIERHADGISVPDLDDPQRIQRGAEHYAEMCTSCHLAPGLSQTELRKGLYPQPPDLSKHGVHDPAEAFWVIKHGVKLTAMPAWGRSHDDAAIWDMVAFVRKLPAMDQAAFEAAAGRAADDGHGGHEHHHDDDGAQGGDDHHEHADEHDHEHMH
ncbi:c-type cytochrome [Dyella telluris]|uniref:Cytochrome c n=1 Tax=Dyella telluris TaxID=2763498 RepID=A0A7G8Q5J4_9GAMM|nr:cytochrome c [Dyella telluris]QNK02052.1 cytochrome c [Dyella telluris]